MGQFVRWFLGLRPTVKTGPIDPRSAPLLLYSSPDELSDTWPARRRTFPPSSDRSCSARLIDEGSRREPYALVVEMPNQRKRGQGDACAQYQNHQVLAFAVRSFRKLSPVHGSLLKLPPPRYLLLSRLTRVQLSGVQADPTTRRGSTSADYKRLASASHFEFRSCSFPQETAYRENPLKRPGQPTLQPCRR